MTIKEHQQFELIFLMELHTYPKHNLILPLQAFEHSNLQPFPAHKSNLLDGDNDFIN
jgi:hypothetical protein